MAMGIRRKLLLVAAARAAAISVVLGAATLAQNRAPGAFPVDPFFFVVGATYALTVVYVLTLGYASEHPWLVELQFAIDGLIVSAIVLLTGGITSYFSSLYVLPIIAASAVQYWRGGLTVAVLSALMYGGLVVSQYAGPFGPLNLWGLDRESELPPLRVALLTLGVNQFGYFAIAILGGYLAESLRRADARLKQASKRIANLEAFNQHVIDSLTSGLATVDARGQLVSFNRAAEQICGVQADGAIGTDAAATLQLPDACREALRVGLKEGRSLRADYGYERGDGRHIELGVSISVLTTPAGPGGFLLTFQDVTDARKREREARVQQRLAAVGEMAAGIAHEIRNPLASMSGSIQVLRDELPLSSEQAQLMDIVLRESERLNDTITSFLAYARPQRNAMQRLDLRRIVEETAVLLSNSPERAETHKIEVEASSREVPCFGDEHQFRQIIWNLATNGLRAMPRGGVLHISVALDEAAGGADYEGAAIIRVRDEGVGIPPEELESMFQPFRGAFARGSGLGLSIVHRIVTDYGGNIDVSSEPGKGTTVEIRLPARSSDQLSVASGQTSTTLEKV